MASENEIIGKIKGFKEQNSPNFKKYMDFYREKFPDFYNSSLKILEEQSPAKFDFSAKGEELKDEVFTDRKIMTSQPIFNINEGKKETNNNTTNGLNHNNVKSAEIKSAAKKSNRKIILIITLVLIIVGAAIGAYFLLI